jgi:hypothetical protein
MPKGTKTTKNYASKYTGDNKKHPNTGIIGKAALIFLQNIDVPSNL